MRKIYQELVLIRKELQAIRSDKESCNLEIDLKKLADITIQHQRTSQARYGENL